MPWHLTHLASAFGEPAETKAELSRHFSQLPGLRDHAGLILPPATCVEANCTHEPPQNPHPNANTGGDIRATAEAVDCRSLMSSPPNICAFPTAIRGCFVDAVRTCCHSARPCARPAQTPRGSFCDGLRCCQAWPLNDGERLVPCWRHDCLTVAVHDRLWESWRVDRYTHLKRRRSFVTCCPPVPR